MAKTETPRPETPRLPPGRYHIAERGAEVLIENLTTGEARTVKKADDLVRQALECNAQAMADAAAKAKAAENKKPAPAETPGNTPPSNT